MHPLQCQPQKNTSNTFNSKAKLSTLGLRLHQCSVCWYWPCEFFLLFSLLGDYLRHTSSWKMCSTWEWQLLIIINNKCDKDKLVNCATNDQWLTSEADILAVGMFLQCRPTLPTTHKDNTHLHMGAALWECASAASSPLHSGWAHQRRKSVWEKKKNTYKLVACLATLFILLWYT